MTLTRYPWVFTALALTLVLGACSTPDDLTAPTLAPQFGTPGRDVGIDVAVTSTGSVAVLSEERGYQYFDSYGIDSSYEKIIWSRYNSNGTLAWTADLRSNDCASEDYYGEPCDTKRFIPRTLVRGANGSTYAVFTTEYEYSSYPYDVEYRVYKLDASGSIANTYYFGDLYTTKDNDGFIDLAVDGSGNMYVVNVISDSASSARKNVVAKYSASGSLIWQRLSNVGTLTSVNVASNGTVFIAGSSGISRLTNAGNVTWTKTGATNDIIAVGTNTVYTQYLTTVRKYDFSGRQLWSKAQSGLSGIVIGDMAADGSANVYLTGKYNVSSSNRNVFTRKLNSSGSTVFTKTFGTSAYDDARGVATVSGSEIYLTGEVQASLGPAYQGGESDAYLRKLSSTGNPVWTR